MRGSSRVCIGIRRLCFCARYRKISGEFPSIPPVVPPHPSAPFPASLLFYCDILPTSGNYLSCFYTNENKNNESSTYFDLPVYTCVHASSVGTAPMRCKFQIPEGGMKRALAMSTTCLEALWRASRTVWPSTPPTWWGARCAQITGTRRGRSRMRSPTCTGWRGTGACTGVGASRRYGRYRRTR